MGHFYTDFGLFLSFQGGSFEKERRDNEVSADFVLHCEGIDPPEKGQKGGCFGRFMPKQCGQFETTMAATASCINEFVFTETLEDNKISVRISTQYSVKCQALEESMWPCDPEGGGFFIRE
jgi:hypothetical protein